MPRGPSPGWSRRTEPILDDWILKSINHAGGKYDADTGHYAKLVYAGCATKSRADQIEDALYRCGRYLHRRKIADIGVHAKARKQPESDGTFSVDYVAINKAHTYKYLIDKHGEDKNKWPYNPRAKNFGQ